MIDRIAEIRTEGEAAIAAAAGVEELERTRIEVLGRKAALPQLLRGVRDLPPDRTSLVLSLIHISEPTRPY